MRLNFTKKIKESKYLQIFKTKSQLNSINIDIVWVIWINKIKLDFIKWIK